MLEEGLVNHPVVGFGESGRKASEMRVLLARIEESEVSISLFDGLTVKSFSLIYSGACIFGFFFHKLQMYFHLCPVLVTVLFCIF